MEQDKRGAGLSNRAKTEVDEEMVPLTLDLKSENDDDDPVKEKRNLWSAKNASLFLLVLQQSGLVLMIRYSRTIIAADHIPYIPSVVVVSAEVVKFLLNWALEITTRQPVGDTKSTGDVLKTLVNMESIKILIPALLYLIQNNLLFVALKNLSVPVYQVLNQGKLFTTALFSRLLLDKKISCLQYFSLLTLAAGVVIVQQSHKGHQSKSSPEYNGNHWVGFLAVLVSCFTSGFATVYFEKVLKQRAATSEQLSVYVRNMQLAFYSFILGAIPIISDWQKVKKDGLFQGYTWVVLIIIVFHAITGLLVALVMKYADALLKGFATSVAVVLATVLSIFIFKDTVNLLFLVGTTLVVSAVRIYTKNAPH